jgi:CRISPR-associated protein Cas5a/b/c
MAVGFIVDLEFAWGFQTRVAGLAKTSPSFYYPPPTVVLGGIAESVARKHEIGENNGKMLIPTLSRNLLAIGIKLLNCIPITYQALGRIIAIREARGVKYPNPEPKYVLKSFDAPARGHTILSAVDDDAPKMRVFIVLKNNKIIFRGNEFKLAEEEFWRIHRLGSKESLISVLDVTKVEHDKLNESRNSIVETTYSFPVNGGFEITLITCEGLWREEDYIDPFKVEAYDKEENPIVNYMFGRKLIKFKIPLKNVANPWETPTYKLEIRGRAVAYMYNGEAVIGYGES